MSSLVRLESEIAGTDTGLRLERTFARRRGLFLSYNFSELADATDAGHRACRLLELVDAFARDAGLPLRFAGDYRFALSLPRDPDPRLRRKLEGFIEHLNERIREPPSALVSLPLTPQRRLPPELRADWKEQLAQVALIEDGLGRRVDRGIRATVAALLMSGFRTEMSCEGHLRWGQRTPWVTVGQHPARYRRGNPSEAEYERRLQAANRRLAERLRPVVEAFNATRPGLPIWQRLVLCEAENDVGSSVEFYGGCRLYDREWRERRELLKQLQHEMLSFSRYLRAELADNCRWWLWRFDD